MTTQVAGHKTLSSPVIENATMAASTDGTIPTRKNLNELIAQILDITEEFPRAKAATLIALLLEEQAVVNDIASRIVISDRPTASDINFKAVANGKRQIDGKLYTVFQLSNVEMLLRPNEAGRALSDDEIKSTLSEWNKDAKETLKGLGS